ncbi:MAG: hypothetical protein ACMUEM_05105 [Flavobacteriales bacterium AspAUS03]
MCTVHYFTWEIKEGILSSQGIVNWNEKYYQRFDAKFKNLSCLKYLILPICKGDCSQQAIESTVEFCMMEDIGMSK